MRTRGKSILGPSMTVLAAFQTGVVAAAAAFQVCPLQAKVFPPKNLLTGNSGDGLGGLSAFKHVVCHWPMKTQGGSAASLHSDSDHCSIGTSLVYLDWGLAS